MLDFCRESKEWEIQKFFFEIGPHLDTVSGTFLNRAPSNLRILIKLVLLVLDMLRWNSVLLFFREEDSGDLLFSIRVTFDFFEFFSQLKFFTSALIFQHFFQVLTQLFA